MLRKRIAKKMNAQGTRSLGIIMHRIVTPVSHACGIFIEEMRNCMANHNIHNTRQSDV